MNNNYERLPRNYTLLSDEYEFTMPATNVMTNPTFEKKEVIDLITNPETGLKISVFLIAIISLGTGIYVYQKKESKKI